MRNSDSSDSNTIDTKSSRRAWRTSKPTSKGHSAIRGLWRMEKSHFAENQDVLVAHRVPDSLNLARNGLVERHHVRSSEFDLFAFHPDPACLIRLRVYDNCATRLTLHHS